MQRTKAIVLKEPGKLALETIAVPRLGGATRLMKVKACGVCGSDVRYLKGENPWALLTLGKTKAPNPKNIILGHEFAGTVQDDGKDRLVFANTRKGCQTCEYCMGGREQLCANLQHYGHGTGWGEMEYYPGGMCEFTEVWEDRLHFLPDNTNPEDAALIEPTSVALHSVRSAGVQAGQEVAVLGLGPIGLLVVQTAKLYGAHRIFGVDLDETPLKAAEEVGCTSPIHAKRYDPLTVIKEQTQGKGVDVVLSNLHNPQDIYKAMQMVKRGGVLVLAYGPEGNLTFPFADLCGERRIMPVVGYSEADEALSIDFISKKRISGKSLITHRFSLEEAEEAFEVSMNKEKHKAILVMIKP